MRILAVLSFTLFSLIVSTSRVADPKFNRLGGLSCDGPDVLKAFVILVAVFYLLFFIVRSLMKDITRSREEARTMELDLGEMPLGDHFSADSGSKSESEEDQQKMSAFADLLQQAKELAKNDPRMVATILREWMANAADDKADPNKIS